MGRFFFSGNVGYWIESFEVKSWLVERGLLGRLYFLGIDVFCGLEV